MKIQRCKGMRDLYADDMKTFRYVEGICRECFIKWGYHEVRTPTIEYLHLFTSAGTLTPGMLGKVYSFLDWDGWSGERVVLRPDGTIPVARLYAESKPGQGTARFCYVANVFTFEESADRPRERWQGGAELIGAGAKGAEVELIALALEILEKLGLKNIELRLSHAGLINALLGKLGLSKEAHHRLFDRILDGDAAALSEINRQSPGLQGLLQPLLRLNGQSAAFLRNQRSLLANAAPEIRDSLDNFLQTVARLDGLGIKYRINIPSGSGFEYYTGIVFQIFAGGKQVGGGGRYDDLIPAMGGRDIPASGFALYFDRLIGLVKPEVPAIPEIAVKVTSEEAMKQAYDIAGRLRQAGYAATIDTDSGRTKARWAVEATAKGFTLVDYVKTKRTEFSSVGELVKNLEGKGGD
jgi:histidyl-tRNA synthetase